MQIAHAAGYLACRVRVGGRLTSDLAGLILLAEAERLTGEEPEAPSSYLEVAADTCWFATQERLRPEAWPGTDVVIAACIRLADRIQPRL